MIRLLILTLVSALMLFAPGRAEARVQRGCADLLHARLPDARVTSVEDITIDAVPVCRIAVTSTPTPQSDVRFELWIPLGTAWNGKFVQLGNGGAAGIILTEALRAVAGRGYAAANTDGGHRADSLDWTDAAVRWTDFSWRAQKVTTDLSRALIAQLKGLAPKRSYFAGCSEGGREALMTAQRFPEDFDGIIAAAPANYYSRLITLYAFTERALQQPGGHLGPDQLALLQRSFLNACGGGAWLRDPLRCGFKPETLVCARGKAGDCLTPGQIASAQALYGGVRFGNGPVVYPGYSGGSETTGANWAYSVAPTPAGQLLTPANIAVANIVFNHLVFPARQIDVARLTDAELQEALAKLAPVMDAANPDLSRFRAHGGKLIQWHGWADAAIPAAGSIMYYEDVRRTMGPVDDFYRLYMIPGMFHCARGPAPSEVDWLTVLDQWASDGRAPGSVPTNYTSGGFIQFPIKGQTLCPYPNVAREGAPGVPAACVAPPPDGG